jgi:hypothetical protein
MCDLWQGSFVTNELWLETDNGAMQTQNNVTNHPDHPKPMGITRHIRTMLPFCGMLVFNHMSLPYFLFFVAPYYRFTIFIPPLQDTQKKKAIL